MKAQIVKHPTMYTLLLLLLFYQDTDIDKLLSCVRLFATLWTVAYQAPLSMGFSRQEDWRGLTFPSPGNLPHTGIEPESPTLQAGALQLSHQGSP